MEKKESRLRRAKRSRKKMRELGVNRLSVHRTPRHMYAQIIGPDGGTVLAAVSTLQKSLCKDLKGTGNTEAAKAVGRAVAEMAKAAGIESVAFDRSGFRYHGRVKALADAAREAGLRL